MPKCWSHWPKVKSCGYVSSGWPIAKLAGERRRKAVCFRQSDHLEVSDQRCEHLPRPVAVTEPCNADCEVRCVFSLENRPSASQEPFFSTSSVTGGTLLERASVRLSVAPATAAWTFSAWSTASYRGRVRGWRQVPALRSPNLTQESRVTETVSSRAGSTAHGLR